VREKLARRRKKARTGPRGRNEGRKFFLLLFLNGDFAYNFKGFLGLNIKLLEERKMLRKCL